MQHFYDSDLQSDHMSDFESDHEAPVDCIKDQKLIQKDTLTRIYKTIYRVGRGMPKPAKPDEVQVRAMLLKENPEEKFKEFNQQLTDTVEINTIRLGYHNYPQWWELSMESMRKGEIICVRIEHLKYDENEMKILDKEDFWMFEMVGWNTCIDLNLDQNWFKFVHRPGVQQDKCELNDEIAFSYQLYNGKTNQLIDEQSFQEPIYMADLVNNEKISRCAWKVFTTMKLKEEVTCKFTYKAFMELENKTFKEKIGDLSIQQESQEIQQQEKDQKEENNFVLSKNKYVDPLIDIIGENYFYVKITVDQIIKVDDIFGDNSALKRIIHKGEKGQKPEKSASMKFEIEIYVGKKKIYSSKKEEKKGYWSVYLDELKISKLLKNSLRRMRKNEISQIQCKDKTLIKYGRDFQIIKEKLDTQIIPDQVIYQIKVIDYEDNKNYFNMTIDEKIFNAQRKKIIGVKLIKEDKNYKKALKTFETINAYFDFGTFYDEDKLLIYEHKLSSLLNTSLCLMQLKNYPRLIQVCDKILEIAPENPKAVYRKCKALKEQGNFTFSIEILDKFIEEYEQKTDQDLIQQMKNLKQDLNNLQNKHTNKEKKMFQQIFKQ